MINYIEKGSGLHKAIEQAGHSLSQVDNIWVSSDDAAVQAIIDSYDPLPEAQLEAINLVNEAAGKTRTKYVTNVPSQDATYQMKLEDAKAFITASYPEASITSYPFVNAEASALASTGKVAADLIVGTYNGWIQLAANIEGERRLAIEQIKAELDWSQCNVIAELATAKLEAM